eukprot:g7130.t1
MAEETHAHVDAFGESMAMPWGPPPAPDAGPRSMKLGAAWNLFDCEELLEASVRSVRPAVDFVVVVVQRVSNFGMPCSAAVLPLLQRLVAAGLVDRVVEYAPRAFSVEQKRRLVSRRATEQQLGGASVDQLGDQFLNELTKRELGRQACRDAGCNYFMSLDADEFYRAAELRAVKALALRRNYECVACRMRYFFKWPELELTPPDELNCVPVLYRIAAHMPFRLACPYPCLIDPTRKLENLRRLHVAERGEVQMYHYSFVRRDMRAKLLNVSNRQNYVGGGEAHALERWAARFAAWQPRDGVMHPHPFYEKAFTGVRRVPNWFAIDVAGWGLGACEMRGVAGGDGGGGADAGADAGEEAQGPGGGGGSEERHFSAAVADSKVSNPEVAAGWLNTGRTHANGSADVMFVIHRSSNENLVCYKGVEAEGSHVGCHPYWIMLAKEGGPTEELNMIERNTAYGLKSEPAGENVWKLQIASLKGMDIMATKGESGWTATTTIGGVEGAVLVAVHVAMKSSWGMPKVDYVEIFGAGGEYEKKNPW